MNKVIKIKVWELTSSIK